MVLLAWSLLLPGLAAGADSALENMVKAHYLYKLAAYVEWPAAAFASPASPFTVCVAGPDPFGETLDRAVVNQRVDGRPIVVRRLPGAAREQGCHIVYLGWSDAQRLKQDLDVLRGNEVLTVSAAAGSDASVNFVTTGNRVRFDIDEEAAAQNGLSISSRLLSLALHVKARQAPPRR